MLSQLKHLALNIWGYGRIYNIYANKLIVEMFYCGIAYKMNVPVQLLLAVVFLVNSIMPGA